MLKRSVADVNFFLEEIVELSTVSPNSHIAIAKNWGGEASRQCNTNFIVNSPWELFSRTIVDKKLDENKKQIILIRLFSM